MRRMNKRGILPIIWVLIITIPIIIGLSTALIIKFQSEKDPALQEVCSEGGICTNDPYKKMDIWFQEEDQSCAQVVKIYWDGEYIPPVDCVTPNSVYGDLGKFPPVLEDCEGTNEACLVPQYFATFKSVSACNEYLEKGIEPDSYCQSSLPEESFCGFMYKFSPNAYDSCVDVQKYFSSRFALMAVVLILIFGSLSWFVAKKARIL